MKKGTQAAFPVDAEYGGDGPVKGVQTGPSSGYEFGLSKREYFAAKAMQGLIGVLDRDRMPYAAEVAVRAADALIAELEK